jgi:hypothetical protein
MSIMTHETNIFRPPAVPLVVNDPYLSVWSMNDTLTDGWSKHWTGATQAMSGLIRIDNVSYRFMGDMTHHYGIEAPPMRQTSVKVLPTRTIYTFEIAGIRLKLTFLTPLLPHDLELLSRPTTYIEVAVEAIDGSVHDIAIYIDIAASWVVNIQEQRVVWGRHRLDDRDVLWMGSVEQDVLGKAGDNLRIDWGYLYTVALQSSTSYLGQDMVSRAHFVKTGTLPQQDRFDMPDAVDVRPPYPISAWCFDIGEVTEVGSVRQLLIAYDDQFSVEYMHRKLRPYWRRNGWGAADLIHAAINEYPEIKQRCEDYDIELIADLTQAGGVKYARLATLSFRQCLAAHKLVAEHDGTPRYFSKENFSNGCMGTVDVMYPASPFFLLLNPDLLEAQLTPILDYASSAQWKFPFAPHDVGRYPLANGQVYGGGEQSELNQMPVEECGNMLIQVAALCKTRNDVRYAAHYWVVLSQWAAYLLDKGFDPDNQLCTDDFAGHLAHNVNLSVKAILGVGAFAQLCEQRGLTDEAVKYRTHAEEMVDRWLHDADDGEHYRLTFDKPGTWSQKYNLVWDNLLGLGLFPDEVVEKEITYYKTKLNTYGLPLDNRSTYTKLDWSVWIASMSDKPDDFAVFIDPIYRWMNDTESRVPLTDWYFTDTGLKRAFQARPVVGGVFIRMLYDTVLWDKWRVRNQST